MPQFHRRGFSLLELSITLGIIGVAARAAMVFASDIIAQRRAIDSKLRIDEIMAALDHYQELNGLFPCVASRTALPEDAEFGVEVATDSACRSYTAAPAGTLRVETSPGSGIWVLIGALPVRDLMLEDSLMQDGYGNRYSYVVMQSLTDSATFPTAKGKIVIQDGAANSIIEDGAYAVFSHGKDGLGAFLASTGALKSACSATNLDKENCNWDATLADAPYNDGAVAANYFDDYIRWQSRRRFPSTEIGFRADGVAADNSSGQAVAAGDINNDGYDDLIIGAHAANKIYVVFGKKQGIPNPLPLSSLDGSNGFRIDGTTGATGSAVAAGDINNDGYDDLIIGAPNTAAGGHVWVVFGKAGAWAATQTLATGPGNLIDGTQGFQLGGSGGVGAGKAGISVAAGDINGDGYDDVIAGAYWANSTATQSGSTYVVFGKAGAWSATNTFATGPGNFIDGTQGFRLDGTPGSSGGEESGRSVAAGDLNDDGYDDLIIGAWNALDQNGFTYVVFGRTGAWPATEALYTGDGNLIDGTQGFRLDGVTASNYSGGIATGDINGDGKSDIISGKYGADPNGLTDAGSTFVVFAKEGAWPANQVMNTGDGNLIDGVQGFRFDGGAAGGQSGWSVAAGDINGDGKSDLIIGANWADPNGVSKSGSTYVIFGQETATWDVPFDLGGL